MIGAAVLLAVAVGLAAPGFASGLNSASNSLGANKAAVAKCDPDGVGVIQNLAGANVTTVTVSGIAGGCAGGTLSVSVDNATTASTGTALVPVGGGVLTVPLALAVPAKDVEEIDAVVSGP